MKKFLAKRKPNFVTMKQKGSFPSLIMKRGGDEGSSRNGDGGWKFVDEQLCSIYKNDKDLFTLLIEFVKEELDLLNIHTHLKTLGVQLWKDVMSKTLETVFEGSWPVEKVEMLPGEDRSFTFKNVTLEEDDEIGIKVDKREGLLMKLEERK
ncbi:unnamed protein product [Arabis nemorensis]|uniref:Uncharacterized protein n=1 Tax=Arabis nemorensis TaxID=586526 RepID=A0A565CAL7_9BRAS|nr:unnamed protein product [Arabis nemorensis]